MQLREYLPFDVRQVMACLPRDGDVRHQVRNFTLNPRVQGRARSVKALAESLGLYIYEQELPRGQNGRLTTDPFSDSGFAIIINSKLSVMAKRFAVLHELGHFFRHRSKIEESFDDTFFDLSGQAFYVNKTEEREANEFAEALLFGAGQLAAAVGLVGSDPKKLSRYFGVTEPVIKVAMRKLRV